MAISGLNLIESLIKAFGSGSVTVIRCDKRNATRIVRRAMSQGWWFSVVRGSDSLYRVVLPAAVDLEKDLRFKLPCLEFKLDID